MFHAVAGQGVSKKRKECTPALSLTQSQQKVRFAPLPPPFPGGGVGGVISPYKTKIFDIPSEPP